MNAEYPSEKSEKNSKSRQKRSKLKRKNRDEIIFDRKEQPGLAIADTGSVADFDNIICRVIMRGRRKKSAAGMEASWNYRSQQFDTA